jgi:riboflavin kinase/FMN adenylyltransferase
VPADLAALLAGLPDRLKGGAVAIGNFDGVHRGHQAVIAHAMAHAGEGPTVVVTFEPHPRSFFKPQEPVFRLTPSPLRERMIRALGVDHVLTLPFDAELAGLDAETFVARVLVGALRARHVVAGFDFHFGKNRGGSPAFLADAGRRLGFAVDIVDAFGDQAGTVVSSSLIRGLLAEGDITGANAELGWRWLVEGEVIHGDKRGRVLGYPTANMALPPETQLAHGVYAVRAHAAGAWYAGAANWGRRIQFGDGPSVLETYILDFSGDLYGKRIRVEFCGYLRPEAKFDSVEALVEQMGRDVDEARAIVNATILAPRTALQARLEER